MCLVFVWRITHICPPIGQLVGRGRGEQTHGQRVMAHGFANLFILDKRDLSDILVHYPESQKQSEGVTSRIQLSYLFHFPYPSLLTQDTSKRPEEGGQMERLGCGI